MRSRTRKRCRGELQNLSSEEMFAAVFQQQGFLVLGSNRFRKVGETIPNPFSNIKDGERIQVALLIVAASTKDEFDAQSDLAEELLGVKSYGEPGFAQYWRTVPQD